MLARLLIFALQIQGHARGQVCLEEVRGELQGANVKGQRLILLALAIQLLALFDKLKCVVRLCVRRSCLGLCTEKNARKEQCCDGVIEEEDSQLHRRAIIEHCAPGEERISFAANSADRRNIATNQLSC